MDKSNKSEIFKNAIRTNDLIVDSPLPTGYAPPEPDVSSLNKKNKKELRDILIDWFGISVPIRMNKDKMIDIIMDNLTKEE